MKIIMNRSLTHKNVIFFKAKKNRDESSAENVDPYEEELGFSPHYVTALSFEFCNSKELNVNVNDHSNFSGLIFTSQRSVEAVNNCLDLFSKDNKSSTIEDWRKNKIFSVGEATQNTIKKLLDWDSIGHESGNAANLVDVIKSEVIEIEKPLLFPCGDQKMRTLVEELPKCGLSLCTLTVYKTICAQNLHDEVEKLLNIVNPYDSVMVFFSPSGVRYVSSVLKDLKLENKNISCVAIGPSTANEIENVGLRLKCTCKKPTPKDVANSVKSSLT